MQPDDVRVQTYGTRDPEVTNGEERLDLGQSSYGLVTAANEYSSVLK